jgi:hypothetical protein
MYKGYLQNHNHFVSYLYGWIFVDFALGEYEQTAQVSSKPSLYGGHLSDPQLPLTK